MNIEQANREKIRQTSATGRRQEFSWDVLNDLPARHIPYRHDTQSQRDEEK